MAAECPRYPNAIAQTGPAKSQLPRLHPKHRDSVREPPKRRSRKSVRITPRKSASVRRSVLCNRWIVPVPNGSGAGRARFLLRDPFLPSNGALPVAACARSASASATRRRTPCRSTGCGIARAKAGARRSRSFTSSAACTRGREPIERDTLYRPVERSETTFTVLV